MQTLYKITIKIMIRLNEPQFGPLFYNDYDYDAHCDHQLDPYILGVIFIEFRNIYMIIEKG